MSLGYAWEKFYSAVRSLISEGALDDRLSGATVNLMGLKPEDFPDQDELRQRFSNLLQNLEGSQEAEKLAEEIFTIFNDIALRDPNHHHHMASDIDLVSHFAATQTTTPEKPNPIYDFKRLTADELRQLGALLEKAMRVPQDTMKKDPRNPSGRKPHPKVKKKGLKKKHAKRR